MELQQMELKKENFNFWNDSRNLIYYNDSLNEKEFYHPIEIKISDVNKTKNFCNGFKKVLVIDELRKSKKSIDLLELKRRLNLRWIL